MATRDKIPSLDLMHNGVPAQFVLRNMAGLNLSALGAEAVPHRHNYYTVIWPFGATGRHIIDFTDYPIEKDHIFFVSPSQVHQVMIDPDPTGFVILFTPEFLERNSIRNDFISNLKLFRNIDETPPLPVSGRTAEKLRLFAESMASSFDIRDDLYLETIGAYLKLFLIECSGQCSLDPGPDPQTYEVSRNLVRGFKDLVEKNFTKWHQVKYYADSLNVTPGYLNDVIRNSVKMPAKEYIQHRIILEARRMIIHTEKNSKEIGFELGFDDPAHFSKFFKTNTGHSLAEFRESLE